LFGVFAFNVVAIAFFLYTISSNNSRVDYLYHNTLVTGSIVRQDTLAVTTKSIEPLVSAGAVSRLHGTGFLQDLYLEILDQRHAIVSSFLYYEYYDEILAGNHNNYLRNRIYNMLVINDFDTFVQHNEPDLIQTIVPGEPPFRGPLVIEFAEGFCNADLKNSSDTIPMLFHTAFLERYGYSIGDYLYAFNMSYGTFLPIHVIGSIMGGHPLSFGRFPEVSVPFMVMHHDVYLDISTVIPGYATVKFTIDPTMNHELDYFRSEVEGFLAFSLSRANERVPIRLHLDDQELRYIVIPLEQNLNLLRQLWPVVLTVTCLLSGAVSFLLMIQKAKLAAILRVMGTSKKQTRLLLLVQQIIICVLGVVIGGAIGFTIGFSSGFFLAVALILCITVINSLISISLITNRQLLTLIQLKE